MKNKITQLSVYFTAMLIMLIAIDKAVAQKSSGTIQGEVIKGPLLETVEKTKNNNSEQSIKNELSFPKETSQNDVRFLLRPKNEAVIASQMPGLVSGIKYNVGQRFKKGDTLISLRCDIQNAQLSAQRARVQEFTLTYNSNLDLLKGNAVSQYEVDIAKAQLSQQRASLKEASIVASACQVKAPFSGGVVSVLVNKFETISLGDPLLKVIDDSSLVMSLNVPSILINEVSKGNFFTIEVDETSSSYRAQVTGVSPAIDPVSKTIELRAVLVKKSPELRPGMSGSAKLDFSEK